jgi:chemosensory pili system protein ChpA (sensor histidine kinase/response regulator)
MVPVSSVTSRLQRAVRQACRLLDKQAELEVRDADTLVDGNCLNELLDPLMHVLRNAVDHGIEAPERRASLGKDPVGRIELAFRREGDYILVRCSNDGAGLDLGAIRATALERGLLEEGSGASDDELARLVLAPGFSTRSEATQVSGRGIGMDVVHSRVLALKGSVHLRSDPGRGLTVELRVPATLLSAHALLVRVRNRTLAVSTRGIEDIHYTSPPIGPRGPGARLPTGSATPSTASWRSRRCSTCPATAAAPTAAAIRACSCGSTPARPARSWSRSCSKAGTWW